MEEKKAVVALCKCKEGKRPFGIRFEQYDKGWIATWAFPIKKESSASREKYDSTVLNGSVVFGDDYPGCPYCGSKKMFVCGSCGRLNCNLNSSNSVITCGWCETTGELTGYDGKGVVANNDM